MREDVRKSERVARAEEGRGGTGDRLLKKKLPLIISSPLPLIPSACLHTRPPRHQAAGGNGESYLPCMRITVKDRQEADRGSQLEGGRDQGCRKEQDAGAAFGCVN